MKELDIQITEENYKRAIIANSGACIIAEAIKEAYPHFSNIKVNVATIRVTDREKGERCTYITPPSVAQTLLLFDRGLKEEVLPKKLRIRELVRVAPIARSASSVKTEAEKKAKRLAQLEAKEQSGATLTRDEKVALTKLRSPRVTRVRPTNEGKIIEGKDGVLNGGRERDSERGAEKKNPNLLGGRTRHFGAKLLEPSVVFKGAVEETAEELAKETISRVEKIAAKLAVKHPEKTLEEALDLAFMMDREHRRQSR